MDNVARLVSIIPKKVANFGSNISILSQFWFLIIMLTFFTAKVGVRGILPWGDFSPVANFPRPTESFSTNSIGLVVISKILNLNDKNSFFIMNLILITVLIILLYKRIKKDHDPLLTKILIILFLGSPIFTLLLGNVGRHDTLTIFGILFFFASKSQIGRLGSILLGCLGSPEHLFAGLLLALICAYSLAPTSYKRKISKALLLNTLYLSALTLWAQIYSDGQTRFNYILPYAHLAIRNFLNNVFLEWYSYFGYLWIVLVYIFINFQKKDKIVIGIVFIFAATFNILMVDKTRDFVIAILPTVMIILQLKFWPYLKKISNLEVQNQNKILGAIAVFVCLSPQIEITFEGVPRAPWQWFITKIMEAFS